LYFLYDLTPRTASTAFVAARTKGDGDGEAEEEDQS
jgi:hypothetical protein